MKKTILLLLSLIVFAGCTYTVQVKEPENYGKERRAAQSQQQSKEAFKDLDRETKK